MGKLLELGSSPYHLTQLIEAFAEYEVTRVNYYGKLAEAVDVHEQQVGSRTYQYDHFNAEQHRFPYPDSTFHAVLCAELIEHLLEDPTHMLSEIHRVLRRDAILVLTTANHLRLENSVSLLKGQNIYDPYSGFGVYARHQREWTLQELQVILEGCGYDVVIAEVADVHSMPILVRLVKAIASTRREHLFVVARRQGDLRCAYPPVLYRSLYPVLGVGRDATIPFAQH